MSYTAVISDSELHCAFIDSESGFWRSRFDMQEIFLGRLHLKLFVLGPSYTNQTNSTNTDTHTHTHTHKRSASSTC